MKRLLIIPLVLVMLPLPLLAQTAADDIALEGAYVRAVPPGQPNSAAFLTLSNAGDVDHALVTVRSDAAEVVELHTHIHDEGVMRMRRIERIEVPAGTDQVLEPGGLHIMLIGLTRQLKPGDDVALTLQLEDGSSIELLAPVRPIEGMGGGHHHMHHDH
jgi:copper(I)-binding protein